MDETRRCTATSKRSGERCGRAAAVGLDVCSMHGAKSPRAVAASQRAVAAQAAGRAVATYGLPVEIDPLDALIGELHRTAGHVAWLGLLIAGLDHAEGGESGLKQYRKGDGGALWERPSVWVELYQHERAHLAKVATDCLKAGVEERQIRLAEDQGRIVADVIRRIVAGLGLDPADPEVRDVVRRELTLVGA